MIGSIVSSDEDTWQQWWDARQRALEAVFGPADDQVFHSAIPLYLGGFADVLRFHPEGMGIAYVTSDLIGEVGQPPSDLGNYELMICLRSHDDWAPNLISKLAQYTLQATLNPWETMDIGPALPKDSSITALSFLPQCRLKVRDRDCGVLLCVGITSDEFDAYHDRGPEAVIELLKRDGVFPFTDLHRRSALSV
jgi:Suppressor of fused protein (SUFU)